MFTRQRSGSVLCPSCGSLVGVNDEQCLICGRRRPGLWGFAALLRNVGRDMGFATLVVWACGALYIASLAVEPDAIRSGGMLSFLSPGIAVSSSSARAAPPRSSASAGGGLC